MTRWFLPVLVIVLAGMASSCGQHEMVDDSRIQPYEADSFFKDGSSARPLVPGTVARGHLKDRSPFFSGLQDGRYVESSPVPVDRQLLERGRRQYDIYCAVCHSRTGDGDGMIVRRGFSPPPSYHIERLRRAPPGYLFAVMSNGTAKMPSYSDVLDEQDRWAVAAYIRTLQRSRHATLEQAPPEVQERLKAMPVRQPLEPNRTTKDAAHE